VIECVANASEGRDASAIAGLANAVCVDGVRVLDIHSDSDHNRSVITFTGPADEIGSAAVRLAIEAAARIDLRTHRGVHPRIGALDVVPFVPLLGSKMEECIHLAWQVGEAIASGTGIPVFLYGRAATDAARMTLAALRRGGIQGLGARIGSAGWIPDFGPSHLHPSAGAVAVGARAPLVAYNICLETTDLALGRRIARAAREAAGGPRGLQALAFLLDTSHQVQISMNLTNIEATPVRVAFEWVSSLARACGVRVAASEIVGLAPRRALAETTAADLLLPGRIEDYTLEERLKTT
jgi:glutamate formiminotransferase